MTDERQSKHDKGWKSTLKASHNLDSRIVDVVRFLARHSAEQDYKNHLKIQRLCHPSLIWSPDMKKVAIYARYSSGPQSDASIEDQIRICSARARHENWQIVNTYTDHGISGTSLMRPGIQMLMQDAMAGKFDVVLAEGLERLSRDQQDCRHLQTLSICRNYNSYVVRWWRSQRYPYRIERYDECLVSKRFGCQNASRFSGRVEKGKSGGGLCYGYRVVKQFDANGEAIR